MTIFKYPLTRSTSQKVSMPEGAVILTAQMQGGTLCLWAKVKPDNEPTMRRIRIFGTGQYFTGEPSYIATVQDGQFVWHVFEETQ